MPFCWNLDMRCITLLFPPYTVFLADHSYYERLAILPLMHAVHHDAHLGGPHMTVCWNDVHICAASIYSILTIEPLAGGTYQPVVCSAAHCHSRFSVADQSPCGNGGHQGTYAVSIRLMFEATVGVASNVALLVAYAQHALAMLLAAAVQLVTSSCTAPGQHYIFNPGHSVLSCHRVQLIEDPMCGTPVRAAVRLRGGGPSVKDNFCAVEV